MRMRDVLHIREIRKEEFPALGQLMVEVFSGLAGFPSPAEQPRYFEMLANIGLFTEKKDAKVLVALLDRNELVGGVVYFGDMCEYGSGGMATALQYTSGIRLLAVATQYRRLGAGKDLTNACIELAKKRGHSEVVLHTTQAMQVAWRMYEKLGFQRSMDLDFMQEDLPVLGFRLQLK
jgi:ribosomal protein S18 acetylase RimI-like enzyme